MNLLGGHNTSPSREVSPDIAAAEGTCIDPSFAEFLPHNTNEEPMKLASDGRDEVEGEDVIKPVPNGVCADSVGGFNIPPQGKFLVTVHWLLHISLTKPTQFQSVCCRPRSTQI